MPLLVTFFFMAMHSTDASCSCPELLLVCCLLLLAVTSYSASTPCNATNRISYCYNLTAPPGSSNGSLRADGYPTAQVNASWLNRDTDGGGGKRFRYDDGSIVRPLLLRGTSGPSFACGFFCRDSCNATFFSIFLVDTNGRSAIRSRSSAFPQVVWSANRYSPVAEGARLQLAPDGRLVLSDSGGGEVWWTDTAGKNVSGMILTEAGNLVLYNSLGDTVWQSFDHATDTVLQGQRAAGQRLESNASAQGKFFINVRNDSFDAFIATVDAPSIYYSQQIQGGVLFPLPIESDINGGDTAKSTVITAAKQFLRLESDGHLRQYSWSHEELSWKVEREQMTGGVSDANCIYPTVCRDYGICSGGQCSCPEYSNYFQPVVLNSQEGD